MSQIYKLVLGYNNTRMGKSNDGNVKCNNCKMRWSKNNLAKN